jgi:hypothetical protein
VPVGADNLDWRHLAQVTMTMKTFAVTTKKLKMICIAFGPTVTGKARGLRTWDRRSSSRHGARWVETEPQNGELSWFDHGTEYCESKTVSEYLCGILWAGLERERCNFTLGKISGKTYDGVVEFDDLQVTDVFLRSMQATMESLQLEARQSRDPSCGLIG